MFDLRSVGLSDDVTSFTCGIFMSAIRHRLAALQLTHKVAMVRPLGVLKPDTETGALGSKATSHSMTTMTTCRG
jgi:hypothetical protein